MATKSSVLGSNSGPAVQTAQAGQVSVVRGSYDLLATDSEDATLQLRVVKLPAQHRIVDLVLDNDDLDGVTAGAINIGIEDSIQDPADTTDLTLFATAVDVQTAANRQNVMSFAAVGLAAQNYDRFIVVTMETVSTTGLVGTLGLTLTSRPELGSQFDGNA
jgi:hypothetical protein